MNRSLYINMIIIMNQSEIAHMVERASYLEDPGSSTASAVLQHALRLHY